MKTNKRGHFEVYKVTDNGISILEIDPSGDIEALDDETIFTDLNMAMVSIINSLCDRVKELEGKK